jgi:phosphoserine phosphatase
MMPTLISTESHEHFVIPTAPEAAAAPRFGTVVLDVDSTISGIEGIDWLASRRGEIISRRVSSLTEEAMRGSVPLEHVYGTRLATIRPRRDDLDALSRAYVEALAPGVVETFAQFRRAGVHIVLMSGGLRHALVRLAFHLGVDLADLHAVDIRFDALGAYTGFDTQSPLTTSDGKTKQLAKLKLDGPVLIVGDGATDLGMRRVTGQFAAFTGFVSREPVVNQADFTVDSFEELASLVLA